MSAPRVAGAGAAQINAEAPERITPERQLLMRVVRHLRRCSSRIDPLRVHYLLNELEAQPHQRLLADAARVIESQEREMGDLLELVESLAWEIEDEIGEVA